MAITLRSEKGSNLTANEVDNNFLELSGSIAEIAAGGGSGGGVSYTSYVAKLVGDSGSGNPVTVTVLENTTGKTFNWTQGPTIGLNGSFPYNTSITGVADAKIVIFALGETLLFEDKAGPEVKITPVSYQISSGNISVWFETMANKLDTGVMVEIRIYP